MTLAWALLRPADDRRLTGTHRVRILLAGLLLCVLALPARAQNAITIVVNFGAGGSADRMARLVAPEIAEALGTQVVVKNTTGAAGAIGAAEVARARPDGGTLLLTTTGPMAIQPHFRADLPYRGGGFRAGLPARRRAGDDDGRPRQRAAQRA